MDKDVKPIVGPAGFKHEHFLGRIDTETIRQRTTRGAATDNYKVIYTVSHGVILSLRVSFHVNERGGTFAPHT